MFKTANHIEAGLWFVIGLAFAGYAFARPSVRVRSFVAAIVFILFGVSDIVEVQTGAWWRPWLLFCWKAACVLAMLIMFVRWRRQNVKDDGD